MAKAVLNTFNRYQAAEYNTATARARTAKQWTDFNADPVANELYPNLRWIRTRSANPRELHLRFAGLVLPKNDPFWLQNQPGNLWNCKCDWEETDDPTNTNDLTPDELDEYRSDGGGIHASGLDGNPAETGEVFTDECTYFKQAGNGKRRRSVENVCQSLARNIIQKEAKVNDLLQKKSICEVQGENHEVIFKEYSIREYADKMFGTKQFWLKNQIVNEIPEYIRNSEWVKKESVDLSHNKGRTLRLKKKLKWFHYFKSKLPDGTDILLEIVEYKTGEFCFYTMVKA
ncbi:MAG: phage head morphogenesis protein [Bacteroidales bacterium]|nr:phage head morphogenesis protein [Bacteroidales bacterium]